VKNASTWIQTGLLVAVLAFLAYRELNPRGVAPAPGPVVARDDRARELGEKYHDALHQAGALMLQHVALGTWGSTAEVTKSQREKFQGDLTAAWKPVADELESRFGKVTEDKLAGRTATEVSRFYAEVAGGYNEQ
jgi:hypothetical protein